MAAAAARKQSEDSLAAMEKFTRMAADRDRQRVAKERKVELLNETSFDRRRQVGLWGLRRLLSTDGSNLDVVNLGIIIWISLCWLGCLGSFCML